MVQLSEKQYDDNADIESQQHDLKKKKKRYDPDWIIVSCLIASIICLFYLMMNAHAKNLYQQQQEEQEQQYQFNNDNNAQRQPQQAVALTTENTLTTFNVNEEYKTIVALSPVIIISWDDETADIPISTISGGSGSASAPNNDDHTVSDFERSTNFKNLLTNYQISPQPQILSLNKHPNYPSLIKHIMKKVEKAEISKKSNFLPGLIINGRPVASAKACEKLHQSGKLLDYLKNWGDGVITVEKL